MAKILSRGILYLIKIGFIALAVFWLVNPVSINSNTGVSSEEAQYYYAINQNTKFIQYIDTDVREMKRISFDFGQNRGAYPASGFLVLKLYDDEGNLIADVSKSMNSLRKKWQFDLKFTPVTNSQSKLLKLVVKYKGDSSFPIYLKQVTDETCYITVNGLKDYKVLDLVIYGKRPDYFFAWYAFAGFAIVQILSTVRKRAAVNGNK